MTRRCLFAPLGLLVLAGCHSGSKTNDQRTASGQVLQGSVSDAMISYESVKSKPPLAPRQAMPGERAGAAAEDAPAAAAAEDAAPDSPAPAPSSAAPLVY